MKHTVFTLATACFLAFPVLAQEAEEEDGFSLMEEGAKLLFRGLVQEMEPALEDLRGFADEFEPGLKDFVTEMGPGLIDLLGKIDDLSVYHMPEILPNGDIIMRRKTPEEILEEKGGEIDI